MTTREAPLFSHDMYAGVSATNLLERLDLERLDISNRLAADPKRRAELGQFFTPATVARFMASMLQLRDPPAELRILDAGGGSGVLTAAAIAEVCARPSKQRPAAIRSFVWEIDGDLTDDLRRTFEHCRTICYDAGIEFTGEIRQENFILAGANLLSGGDLFAPRKVPRFHVAILNPPYCKLHSSSPERACLDKLGIQTSNLYSGFVWLALRMLEKAGEIVAITPRSFMNGSYFRRFRQVLTRELAFRRVHVYEARNLAFEGDDVLQENVIFHGIKGGKPCPVRITTSLGPTDPGLAERTVETRELILPDDPNCVLHVVPDETDAQIARQMRSLPRTLAELSISVSTGRAVAFRIKERLRTVAGSGEAPLIFPQHVEGGFIKWPLPHSSKPNALTVSGPEDKLLLPSGFYVLVKRFSAKEEKRRIVAALYDPTRVGASHVAFDNKLNVLHHRNAGLPEDCAKGLVLFLNSTVVDAYFRQFSGHTQVNAGDLRALQIPETKELEKLGRRLGSTLPPQDEIDQLVKEEILTMSDEGHPVEAKRKVRAAESILKSLKAPKGQQNERSALTLLGLLDLAPTERWSSARSPLRGVTELIDWMAENYGKQYAPNTRETIRRFTLHQFIDMGLVLLNPDAPDRPPNSPKNVYQIESSALELLQSFESEAWETILTSYLESMADQNRLLRRARQMRQIPVTLPDGEVIELTAGGQNVLECRT